MDLEQFRHPSWPTAVGTILGYGAILGVMFVVLFLVPTVIFIAL
jgi:hypothetical protein